jgi:hypothetical protein
MQIPHIQMKKKILDFNSWPCKFEGGYGKITTEPAELSKQIRTALTVCVLAFHHRWSHSQLYELYVYWRNKLQCLIHWSIRSEIRLLQPRQRNDIESWKSVRKEDDDVIIPFNMEVNKSGDIELCHGEWLVFGRWRCVRRISFWLRLMTVVDSDL